MRLEIRRHVLRLARPFETSYGALREREMLLVTLRADDAREGRGEAAPLEPYDGVSIDDARRALERCREPLEEAADPPGDPAAQREWAHALLADCARAAPLRQALAAIDVALWDIAARSRGEPLCALLAESLGAGSHAAGSVPVSATVAALDRAGAAEQAAHAARAGYACVKVKVGAGDDAGRVAAVRAAAGPEIVLRLDANGAWRVPEAIAAISALAPAGLELVEEPVHGAAQLREVRENVEVRIAADESATDEGAFDGAADAVCLKLARSGGITPLLASAQSARASGCEVYIGSTLEGPVGVAAALHAAAALAAKAPLPPCGLATLALFEDMDGVLPVQRGQIAVPTAPGLGVAERAAGER